MDILIPVANNSLWFGNELRFTLRSVEQYLTGVKRIFIVGHKPKFVENVIHIPCPDIGKTKHHRIIHKILHTIKTTDISDDFLFMNDDHFLLKKYSASKFPNYYDMPLVDAVEVRRKSSVYQEYVQNTYRVQPEGLHYDIHCPIIYNKEAFKNAMDSVDWSKKTYLIKSLYGNFNGIKGMQMTDCKLNHRDHYEGRIKDRVFFSTSADMDYPKLKKILEGLYPEPCKYEQVAVPLKQ